MNFVMPCMVMGVLIALVSIKAQASDDVCELISKTFELSKSEHIVGEISHDKLVNNFKSIKNISLIHSEFEGGTYSIPDVEFSSIKEYKKPFRSVFLEGENLDIKIYLDGPTAYHDIFKIAKLTDESLYKEIKAQSFFSLIKKGSSNANAYDCKDGLDCTDLSVLSMTTLDLPKNVYYTYNKKYIAFYGKDAKQAVVVFGSDRKGKIILLSINGDKKIISGYLKSLTQYPYEQEVSEGTFVEDIGELNTK